MQGLFVDWRQSRFDKLSVKVVLSEKRELTDGHLLTYLLHGSESFLRS